MKLLRLLVAPLAGALLVTGVQAQTASDPGAAQRIRADVEFLASDLLEGRDTGSRGHEIAASYVASRFKSIGLKPGGENGGWYQQVPFRRATNAAPPVVSLAIGSARTPLAYGTDVAVRPSLVEKQRKFEAALVFVGHGLVDPRLGLNDYAGIDPRGKIVVALSGTPKGLASDVAAHLGSMKDDFAAQRGAIGYLELPSDGPGARWNSVSAIASRPMIDWVDAQGVTGAGAVARLTRIAVSEAIAARLFKSSRKGFEALRREGKGAKAIRGFDIPGRLAVQANSDWSQFTSPEVIGLLPGSDPALAAQHVVLTGHLDHIGISSSAKPGEDAINNGALDNASGIATMLEAARAFVASGKPPRRSVLFIAHTGEEKGLLGADYFAAHPTVPIGQIVGLVNLDMPLLLYDFRDVIAFGAEHSTLARAVGDAGKAMGVAAAADPMPQESLFVRSDHYRFVTRGVPSVFLMTGYANGGEAKWKNFLAGVYHSPRDDLSQAIDWTAAGRFGELNYRIARTLADADQRPMWYRGSYFGETFGGGQPRAERQP
ncbi:MAG: M20/M25/M40 family metallo-hydrolase [Pseudomonadota bacterium]|nr:M20/M25/M40 family metallo-hydrolase [Pseudomonadota bacterium]